MASIIIRPNGRWRRKFAPTVTFNGGNARGAPFWHLNELRRGLSCRKTGSRLRHPEGTDGPYWRHGIARLTMSSTRRSRLAAIAGWAGNPVTRRKRVNRRNRPIAALGERRRQGRFWLFPSPTDREMPNDRNGAAAPLEPPQFHSAIHPQESRALAKSQSSTVWASSPSSPAFGNMDSVIPCHSCLVCAFGSRGIWQSVHRS